jgi:aminoglycoside N3'-acetyltransferase
MDKQHLQTMLQELHAELEQAQSVQGEERELLQDLMDEIKTVLARGDGAQAAHYASLFQRLAGTLQQFEFSHPTLTLTIGRVVDTLRSVMP